MGLFDEYFGAAKKLNNSSFGSGSGDVSSAALEIYETGERVNGANSKGTILENWYKQKPYAFRFREQTFYLPISPSNLNITTHFATNVISTMYGTIEEHSEQRYFDITIAGTTGMSPRYYKDVKDQLFDNRNTQAIGRAGAPIKSNIAGKLGGFFKRTQALVQNTLNQASDLLGDDEPSAAIDLQRSGYAAFHNFYKFLLLHKRHVMGLGSARDIGKGKSNLRFINYKDNNMYDVAITNFQLSRDASNPMLYNYNITMRAYNLTSADTKDITADLTDRAQELGLDGLETTSAFTKIANKARKAKSAAYSAVAAAKGFGA